MNDKEDKKKEIFSPGNYQDEAFFFEQCTGPNAEAGYAVYQHPDNEVHFEPSFLNMDETVEYFPLERSLWPLAQFPEKEYRVSAVTEPKAVYELVKEYIQAHVELPHETLYDILASWIMASYIPEKFDVLPYLSFIGPKDSGKTRALEVLWQLAYRAVLSPSFSTSALFRTIDKYSLTLCLDEAEIYGNEQKIEAIGILNAGYKKGQYVLRFNNEKGEVDVFKCFGFKALASIKLFVPTIESRSIIVYMRRNVGDVPLRLDLRAAAQLRFELLKYRFNILEQTERILEDQALIDSFLPKTSGRIAELFSSLIAVTPEQIKEKLCSYAKGVHRKREEEEKASYEAEFTQVLLDLQDQVQNGKLSIQAISEKFNLGKPEKQQWNPRSIGRWLKRLGFNSTRLAKGYMGIFYDSNLLGYLEKRYIPKETQQTSLTQPSMEHSHYGEGEVSEVSEVSTGVSPPSLNDLTSVYMIAEYKMKTCGVCKLQTVTCWEAVTNRGQGIPLCEQCQEAYTKKRTMEDE